VFDKLLAEEGSKVGTYGTWVVENSLLRQTATTLPRTLFVLAAGPFRQPVVELKIAALNRNGTSPDYYGGLYLLQNGTTLQPEPRPDSLSCSVHLGDKEVYRTVRLRDNVQGDQAGGVFTPGTSSTLLCATERPGDRPGIAAVGTDAAPGALTNWVTIAPDPGDTPMVRIGLWTYYAQADFAAIAVYESTLP
jgi:hypothetical protein